MEKVRLRNVETHFIPAHMKLLFDRIASMLKYHPLVIEIDLYSTLCN
ncbi:MAG: hypothetical protein K0R19_3121, partial [Bacillota bacterium]|nr:hypothetical protein [Bacillota bacterium]